MKDQPAPVTENGAAAPTPEATAAANEAKSRKTIEERIAETQAELKRLQDAKRKKDQEDRERNERELRSLLTKEKLDLTPAAIWRKALPDIKAALTRATSA